MPDCFVDRIDDGLPIGANFVHVLVEIDNPPECLLRRLDDVLDELGLLSVDFVKIDVEGGERDVLAGAERLLRRKPRPVLLVEVEDRRTRSWDYPAAEIIDLLCAMGFRWYSIDQEGSLHPLNTRARQFEGNYVAIPDERVQDLAHFVKPERQTQ